MTERPGQRLIREQREAREAEERAAVPIEGHVPAGMITSYSHGATPKDDSNYIALEKEAKERVAAMQARMDARHALIGDLAAQIRAARVRLGLTQAETAGLIGEKLNTVHSVENRSGFSIERFQEILAKVHALEKLGGPAPTASPAEP